MKFHKQIWVIVNIFFFDVYEWHTYFAQGKESVGLKVMFFNNFF